jgi:hypothetical protein
MCNVIIAHNNKSLVNKQTVCLAGILELELNHSTFVIVRKEVQSRSTETVVLRVSKWCYDSCRLVVKALWARAANSHV